MNDLQDAIAYWSGMEEMSTCDRRHFRRIMDAARRVATPDYEAAAKIVYGLRHVTTEDGWDEAVPVFTEEAINAALGRDE